MLDVTERGWSSSKKTLCHLIAEGAEEDVILEPTSTVVWGPETSFLMTSGVVGGAGGAEGDVSPY